MICRVDEPEGMKSQRKVQESAAGANGMKIRNRKFRLSKFFLEKTIRWPNRLPKDRLGLLNFSKIVKMNLHTVE